MSLLRRRKPKRPPPSYSNESAIKRISREQHVDVSNARRHFSEMLVFLDLCADSEELLSPPRAVDDAWHGFVLHTRDYEAYCTERFGRIIHHQPTDEPDPKAYERAWERRRKVDPPPALDIWPIPPGKGGKRSGGDGWVGGIVGGDFGGGGDSGGSSCGGSGCGGGGN